MRNITHRITTDGWLR